MILSTKPSEKNVILLRNNIINMSKDSQLAYLHSYEDYLVKNGLDKRCLVFLCGRDRHQYINSFEDIDSRDWLRLTPRVNLADLPDNYLDVVLWNGCDLKTVVRDTINIFPKLKPGARVYVENARERYTVLLNECLTPGEIDRLTGVMCYKKVLSRLVNNRDCKYTVRTINCKDRDYTIFIKGHKIFNPTKELLLKFIRFDSNVAQTLDQIHIIDDFLDTGLLESAECQINNCHAQGMSTEEIKQSVTPFSDTSSKRSYWDTFVEETIEEVQGESVKKPRIYSGPRNVGGVSCFMDSVLYPILIIDNKPVMEMLNKDLTNTRNICENVKLQDLQDELVKMQTTTREAKLQTCSTFINKFRKCNILTAELMDGRQQDDSEFLQLLFQIFDIEPTTVKSKESGLENLAVLEVPIYETRGKSPVAAYQENYQIIKSNALIFHINRTDYTVQNGQVVFKKIIEPIVIDKCIRNKSNTFYLRIITCHQGSASGGHYISYFNKSGKWCKYDDLGSPTVVPVVWDNIKEYVETHCSMLFYF